MFLAVGVAEDVGHLPIPHLGGGDVVHRQVQPGELLHGVGVIGMVLADAVAFDLGRLDEQVLRPAQVALLPEQLGQAVERLHVLGVPFAHATAEDARACSCSFCASAKLPCNW